MKVLYTSDLHGDIRLYEELLEWAQALNSEIVALGGDLFPSFAPSRRYEDMIPNQQRFTDQFLRPFFRRMVDTTVVQRIFIIPGNWDLAYPLLLRKPMDRVVDLDRQAYRLENGYEWVGYPFVPPTPFRPKDYEKRDDADAPWPPQKNPSYVRSLDEPQQLVSVDPQLYLRQRETLQEDLDRLPSPISFRKTVCIMHSPPFGTALDLIYGGNRTGSRSIRAYIDKHQPLITLHGHIHESPELSGTYVEKVGETICVNPGQGYWTEGKSRSLHAVTFELENPAGTLRHTCLR